MSSEQAMWRITSRRSSERVLPCVMIHKRAQHASRRVGMDAVRREGLMWQCISDLSQMRVWLPQHRYLPIFRLGTLIRGHKNYILKELYIFAVSLSHKFTVCILIDPVFGHSQSLTKLQNLNWGAYLLIKTIPIN